MLKQYRLGSNRKLPLSADVAFFHPSSARLLRLLLISWLALLALLGFAFLAEIDVMALPEPLKKIDEAMVLPLWFLCGSILLLIAILASVVGLFFGRIWAAEIYVVGSAVVYVAAIFFDPTPTIYGPHVGPITSLLDALQGATMLFLIFALQRAANPADGAAIKLAG